MRRSITLSSLVLWGCIFIAKAAGDESALRTRASQFYQFQIAGQRAKAAQFVDPKTRDLFLNGKPLPYTAYKVGSVRMSGPLDAEVEITVEMLLPMFPAPVSKTLVTPWKKVKGRWYFVVDRSALEVVTSQGKATAVPEDKPALSAKMSVIFGLDPEFKKSVRLENTSAALIHFRVAALDTDWFDVINRSGEIPAGESFPLVVVLKQLPSQRRNFAITLESVDPEKRITRLEIAVEVNVPSESFRKEMERAMRIYRAEQ